MHVLTISGSSGEKSSNAQLLDSIPSLYSGHKIERYTNLGQLPLFQASDDHYPWPAEVLCWRGAVASADAIVICTPEYIHNVPAQLKSALEWLSSSGELVGKRVLAMTYTPTAPRGEKAMQSLLWSLQALNANVVAELQLYKDETKFDEQGQLLQCDGLSLLQVGMKQLGVV